MDRQTRKDKAAENLLAILERYVEDLPAPEQQAKWHGLKQTVAKMKTRANLDNQANRRRQGRVAHHFK